MLKGISKLLAIILLALPYILLLLDSFLNKDYTLLATEYKSVIIMFIYMAIFLLVGKKPFVLLKTIPLLFENYKKNTKKKKK